MPQPRPIPYHFATLIVDIERGRVKIPQFQRDFVWPLEKCASLLDSIVKEYPIGSFIFWKTKERLRSVRNIGGITLPDTEEGDYVSYILDGQQRITSIYASLKGIEDVKKSDGRSEDFSKIFVNLSAKEDEKIVTAETDNLDREALIRVTDLLNGSIELINSQVPKQYHSKLSKYKDSINTYICNAIQVEDIPIDIATEIFTRVNLGGETLTLFEIMVAKTFDPVKKFDLAERYHDLMEELKAIGYETISASSILQTISLIISKSKECKRSTILNLDKASFIDAWDGVIDALREAVDYLRTLYGIPVSKLLPYNAILVPFTYFFYKKGNKPDASQKDRLMDFFWRISLSGRYSSSVESKLSQDIKRIDKILKGEDASYDWPINISANFIKENGWFSAGRSYVKAILCLYASKIPRSFADGSKVIIDNAWLKQANSKNYHHFFPKAYLTRKGYNNELYINNVVNITIVDDFLNKRRIRDSSPSKYMKEYQRENKRLSETMKSHLIGDLNEFGIWDNDFEKFMDKRASLISNELKVLVIEREIDKMPQSELKSDETDYNDDEGELPY
jgi:hypothetical protein